jgi:2-succinyl-6-hydroxy-2,4-cyclohexadiene-1-carboxylate synthase
VLALDLPGHGGSGAIAATIPEAAALVEATVDGEPFDLLGYSLGGRVALSLALQAPEGLGRLVLIGATPGIADDAARAERRARDDALADVIEAEDDVDAFLARWLAQPMFATLPREAAQLESRRTNTAKGLAASLRTMGVGTQDPLWSQLGNLMAPTLALAGITDARFADAASKMASALGDATVSLVPGARHACHLEQPALCARTVTTWLDT